MASWTGFGSATYWNAFVANLEMHGVGRFWDPRLNDASRFPIAAKAGLPTPLTKEMVNAFEVDFYWPAQRLVVEHHDSSSTGPPPTAHP